jgi:hypothetical protein
VREKWGANWLSFIVAYRVRGDVIELMRVLHGRQRWPGF